MRDQATVSYAHDLDCQVLAWSIVNIGFTGLHAPDAHEHIIGRMAAQQAERAPHAQTPWNTILTWSRQGRTHPSYDLSVFLNQQEYG